MFRDREGAGSCSGAEEPDWEPSEAGASGAEASGALESGAEAPGRGVSGTEASGCWLPEVETELPGAEEPGCWEASFPPQADRRERDRHRARVRAAGRSLMVI